MIVQDKFYPSFPTKLFTLLLACLKIGYNKLVVSIQNCALKVIKTLWIFSR